MAVLVAATVGGAAVGATIGRSPKFRYRAEAVVTADGPGAEAHVSRLAAAMSLPEVVDAVSQASGFSETVVGRFSTTVRPKAGLLIVRTHDASPSRARALADALVSQTETFLELARTYGGRAARIGDFEKDFGAWIQGRRYFAAGPRDMRLVEGKAQFNRYALEAVCPAQSGCGPSVRLYHPFRTGDTYTATGWIRSDTDTTLMTMVLGATSVDLSQMPARRLGRKWRRYLVNWTPATDRSWAELTFQTAERAPARFTIDGVALWDRRFEDPLRAGSAAERSLFRAGRRDVALPAISTSETRYSTAIWAALGALVGLLSGFLVLGLLALGIVTLARSD